jgi:secreted trypsin-like serine protease
MMRAPLMLAIFATLFAAAERAQAISREEDIVRDLSETFKAPSVFPPNPALRPSLNGARVPNDNAVDRTIVPLGPDLGPPPEQAPDLVPDRLYPFLVAIVNDARPPQEGYICAGTRIAPRWVVTAAHCTFAWVRRWPVNPQPYVLFDTMRLSQPGPKVAVTKIVPHPNYDPRNLRNDIALLRIDTKGQDFGPPLSLDGPPIERQVGEVAFVAGWGVTNLSLMQRQRSETQQALQVAIRGPSCFSGSNYAQLKGTGVFCASSPLRYHDTCYRFSGGPLILRNLGGERYLAGMVSWPAVCPPEVDRMNVYLDVQHFVPWIKSVIQANGGSGR